MKLVLFLVLLVNPSTNAADQLNVYTRQRFSDESKPEQFRTLFNRNQNEFRRLGDTPGKGYASFKI